MVTMPDIPDGPEIEAPSPSADDPDDAVARFRDHRLSRSSGRGELSRDEHERPRIWREAEMLQTLLRRRKREDAERRPEKAPDGEL